MEEKDMAYKDLKKEFDNKVVKLRAICKHEKISDWIREEWAFAHSTGYKVKICEICEQIVERSVRFINK